VCSVNKVACTSGVNLLEGESSALVKHTLGLQAPVLIIAVRSHASTERLQIQLTELVQDVLAG
jgi:hypothetical protein